MARPPPIPKAVRARPVEGAPTPNNHKLYRQARPFSRPPRAHQVACCAAQWVRLPAAVLLRKRCVAVAGVAARRNASCASCTRARRGCSAPRSAAAAATPPACRRRRWPPAGAAVRRARRAAAFRVSRPEAAFLRCRRVSPAPAAAAARWPGPGRRASALPRREPGSCAFSGPVSSETLGLRLISLPCSAARIKVHELRGKSKTELMSQVRAVAARAPHAPAAAQAGADALPARAAAAQGAEDGAGAAAGGQGDGRRAEQAVEDVRAPRRAPAAPPAALTLVAVP